MFSPNIVIVHQYWTLSSSHILSWIYYMLNIYSLRCQRPPALNTQTVMPKGYAVLGVMVLDLGFDMQLG